MLALWVETRHVVASFILLNWSFALHVLGNQQNHDELGEAILTSTSDY